MRSKPAQSSRAITRVSVALVAGLCPVLAVGQSDAAAETAEAELAEVVVTGSRIQRRDASAVGPLTTLTAEDIAVSAPTSAGDLLQALPSVGVSLNTNGTQGTSFGVSSINLRYLGSAEGSGMGTSASRIWGGSVIASTSQAFMG